MQAIDPKDTQAFKAAHQRMLIQTAIEVNQTILNRCSDNEDVMDIMLDLSMRIAEETHGGDVVQLLEDLKQLAEAQ